MRVGDTDPYQKRYLQIDEEQAIKDQTDKLSAIGSRIMALWQEMHHQDSVAAKIAKDAELLECTYSARELYWKGIKEAQKWLPLLEKRLQTSSAKRLISNLLTLSPTNWWENLNSIDG